MDTGRLFGARRRTSPFEALVSHVLKRLTNLPVILISVVLLFIVFYVYDASISGVWLDMGNPRAPAALSPMIHNIAVLPPTTARKMPSSPVEQLVAQLRRAPALLSLLLKGGTPAPKANAPPHVAAVHAAAPPAGTTPPPPQLRDVWVGRAAFAAARVVRGNTTLPLSSAAAVAVASQPRLPLSARPATAAATSANAAVPRLNFALMVPLTSAGLPPGSPVASHPFLTTTLPALLSSLDTRFSYTLYLGFELEDPLFDSEPRRRIFDALLRRLLAEWRRRTASIAVVTVQPASAAATTTNSSTAAAAASPTALPLGWTVLERVPIRAVAPPSVVVDWTCFHHLTEGLPAQHNTLARRAYTHGADFFLPLTMAQTLVTAAGVVSRPGAVAAGDIKVLASSPALRPRGTGSGAGAGDGTADDDSVAGDLLYLGSDGKIAPVPRAPAAAIVAALAAAPRVRSAAAAAATSTADADNDSSGSDPDTAALSAEASLRASLLTLFAPAVVDEMHPRARLVLDLARHPLTPTELAAHAQPPLPSSATHAAAPAPAPWSFERAVPPTRAAPVVPLWPGATAEPDVSEADSWPYFTYMKLLHNNPALPSFGAGMSRFFCDVFCPRAPCLPLICIHLFPSLQLSLLLRQPPWLRLPKSGILLRRSFRRCS
jgi:hypothetical protein